MQEPRRRVSHLAMGAVVATVALISPLLTLWSTTLVNAKGSDPNQFVSLLAGVASGNMLQSEVAVTGAVLLVFASNTATIGSYHVFPALSRMRFLRRLLERRNQWRKTPHWAILIAMGIPVLVLLAVRGNVGLLGDLNAFGLLGDFSMTCVSLDIVRWHERHAHPSPDRGTNGSQSGTKSKEQGDAQLPIPSRAALMVGVITTILVTLAWTTNLFAKPLATLFGGAVTVVGLAIAFTTHALQQRRGLPTVFPLIHRAGQPIFVLSRARRMRPVSVLAILPAEQDQARRVTEDAADSAHGKPIVFLHRGVGGTETPVPELFEIVSPYLNDRAAQEAVGAAERITRERRLDRRYLYLPRSDEPTAVAELWKALQPDQTIVALEDKGLLSAISCDERSAPPDTSAPILQYTTKQ